MPNVKSRDWNLNLIFFLCILLQKKNIFQGFSSDLTEQNIAFHLQINIYIKWFDV